jgi:dienelactone hydrolase
MATLSLFFLGLVIAVLVFPAPAGAPLPGTKPLEEEGDLAAQMVEGLDRFITREGVAAAARRKERWQRDLASPARYGQSVELNRARFRAITGVVDARVPHPRMETVRALDDAPEAGRGRGYRVLAVRWPVLKGLEGEGLLLEPDRPGPGGVVALPDCDWTPEMLVGLAPGVPPEAQFARRLAENGCRVVVPALIDRSDTFSGLAGHRWTNQPHREFVYRAAFEMGHHLIGYEVQKVLAAVDWLAEQAAANGGAEGRKNGSPDSASTPPRVHSPTQPVRIGLIGYGEGGLLALYAAAADPRIDAACVAGYFGPREGLWQEPIYRNVWDLLSEFGDAELASLVAPRALIVEACRGLEVAGPPPVREGRSGAAPGRSGTPPVEQVRAEVERARAFTAGLKPPPVLRLVESGGGHGLPGSEAALSALLQALDREGRLLPLGEAPRELRQHFDPQVRLQRQFDQLVEQTQELMRDAPARRAAFWSRADASSPDAWRASSRAYRDRLWDEVIGRLPPASLPPNPRSRLVYDEPAYRGYEVVLDVWPDVFAYGILLLPKDLRPGERRPVVVCQHGLEGRPQDVADPKVDNPSYHRYACRLAERGFITFAPQNPYIGGDRFRVLQRKANPVGKSLFSFIVRQHERILEWLAAQPFVDRERIGFYGLSYGGKTAMRVPALLEGYALSICSADYNEWIWKNVSSRDPHSYLLTGEYEMPEFNLGNTFNYAELSWLICPRPFMVERGHDDGVAPDEWVAYEFARTRRQYDRLGIGDRTEIEIFNGPHTIHAVGTFEFLHRHLRWPKSGADKGRS